ncbi:MAG: hypothetical protein K6F09_07415 [Clostridiales bacterium]|nr:hypothetical protein [Clostridiales bacterium]
MKGYGMMKNNLKNTLCFLLFIAMIFSFVSMAFAEGGETTEVSSTVVTGYDIIKGDMSGKIRKGNSIDIVVSFKNLTLKTSGIKASDIDVTHIVDSFKGNGNPKITITSSSKQGTDPLLTFDVRFTSLTYTGSGRSLNFYVRIEGFDAENCGVNILECVEDSDEIIIPDVTEPTTNDKNNDDNMDNEKTEAPSNDTTDKTEADKTPTETTTKKDETASVQIDRKVITGPIKPGDIFTLPIILKNTGSIPIESGIISFTPSESLDLLETSSSKAVTAIKKGAEQIVEIKLQVNKNAEAPSQSVSVSFRYNYKTSDGMAQSTEDEKLNIQLTIDEKITTTTKAKKAKVSDAAPNIIVSSYSYGGAVAAGKSFTLTLEFKNTSDKIKAENIVMSVETMTGLSISSSSNTFYFDSLSPLGKQIKKIKMEVPPNTPAGAATLSISFKYDYIQDNQRESMSSSENLSIPVFLPDRFTVSQPEHVFGVQNEEISISLPYINKGKGSLRNVEATLIFDDTGITCEQSHQNLGNFDSGSNGTIDFFLTSENVGDFTVKIKISYEDEMEEVKVTEVPVMFSVEEAETYPDFNDYGEQDEQTEQSFFSKFKWLFIIGGAALLIIIAVVVIVKIKKKKRARIADTFDWDTIQNTGGNGGNDKTDEAAKEESAKR